jgi:magnesium transporter
MAFFNKRYHPAGTPPGTLTRPAPMSAKPLRIRLVDYDRNELAVLDDIAATDCKPFLERNTITWVHVAGHPNEAVLRSLADAFGLHVLALEDILNAGQRPKVETFDDQLFVVTSLPYVANELVATTQIAIFVSKTFLISFCEEAVGSFQTVVSRLQRPTSRLRSRGVDFLLYSLLDFVVDQGFPILDNFGRQLDELEIDILEAADRDTLATIHSVKRDLIMLRGRLWPQREVINRLLRDEDGFIGEGTQIYLRDCYDHTIQIIDLLEIYREMTAGMQEIYLSTISNRMNDIMRVLTIIATVFIPLTFIVGVYGMNFDPGAGPWSMPELQQPLGYAVVWLLMIFIAGLMLVYFRRKSWL